MKTLIIVIHPDLENSSIVNKRLVGEISNHPEKFDIHDLYQRYPDGNINVTEEQNRIESYDKIVFQFPVYWLSSPPLLKKWLDEVLTYGWAYGASSTYKLKGKKIALALTASADEASYAKDGEYKYTLKEFTAPFEITFDWLKADYKPFFVFYGAPHATDQAAKERIDQHAKDYISYIEAL